MKKYEKRKIKGSIDLDDLEYLEPIISENGDQLYYDQKTDKYYDSYGVPIQDPFDIGSRITNGCSYTDDN